MRRVVVTGANRGLGLEFTRQLLAAGDEVVATARDPKLADELQKLATTSGGRVTVVRLDVADPDGVDAAALHIGERFDAVDLLINNAGIWSAPGQPERASAGALAELRAEPVLEVLRVNAVAPILVTQALAPLLAAARPGGRGQPLVRARVDLGAPRPGQPRLRHEQGGPQHAHPASGRRAGRPGDDRGGDEPRLGRHRHGRAVRPRCEPAESVHGILNVVDALTPAQSGMFLDHTGATLPW